MSKRSKIILSILALISIILIGVVFIFNFNMGSAENKSIENINQRISLDPESTISVLDEVNKNNDIEFDFDLDNTVLELEKISDEYLNLDQCKLDKLYTANVDLGFLENYGLEVELIEYNSGDINGISNLVNSLIQKEVQYLLYDSENLDKSLEGIAGEAGIVLLPVEKPEINENISSVYRENLKTIQTVLVCS